MQRAFTLIELLVVTGIIALMIILVFPNYRTGQEDINLQISASKLAQNLRRAQEMAVSVKEFQGAVPGGYGIYFYNLFDPTHYILFADKDGGKDYDGALEIVETIALEKNIALKSLSPAGPLTVIFSPPDPTVYFYPDAATALITIEAEKLRRQIDQYTYRRVDYCSWWQSYCSGWLTPRASCDISQQTADCPSSFAALASDPSIVYDQFWSGSWKSLKYQKWRDQTIINVQKTVTINKAGLIAIE